MLKYYECQLTKRCLEGRLEGFRISSWFLKIMKVVEYRTAKIFIMVVDGCIIIIHEINTSDSTLMKQSSTLTANSKSVMRFCFLKEKSLCSGTSYKTKDVFIRSSHYYYC